MKPCLAFCISDKIWDTYDYTAVCTIMPQHNPNQLLRKVTARPAVTCI